MDIKFFDDQDAFVVIEKSGKMHCFKLDDAGRLTHKVVFQQSSPSLEAMVSLGHLVINQEKDFVIL